MLLIGYVTYNYIDLFLSFKACEAFSWQRLDSFSHKQFCLLPQCDIKLYFLCVLRYKKCWTFGVEKEWLIVQKAQWYVIALVKCQSDSMCERDIRVAWGIKTGYSGFHILGTLRYQKCILLSYYFLHNLLLPLPKSYYGTRCTSKCQSFLSTFHPGGRRVKPEKKGLSPQLKDSNK